VRAARYLPDVFEMQDELAVLPRRRRDPPGIEEPAAKPPNPAPSEAIDLED
jgi:hypothetical protein